MPVLLLRSLQCVHDIIPRVPDCQTATLPHGPHPTVLSSLTDSRSSRTPGCDYYDSFVMISGKRVYWGWLLWHEATVITSTKQFFVISLIKKFGGYFYTFSLEAQAMADLIVTDLATEEPVRRTVFVIVLGIYHRVWRHPVHEIVSVTCLHLARDRQKDVNLSPHDTLLALDVCSG